MPAPWTISRSADADSLARWSMQHSHRLRSLWWGPCSCMCACPSSTLLPKGSLTVSACLVGWLYYPVVPARTMCRAVPQRTQLERRKVQVPKGLHAARHVHGRTRQVCVLHSGT